MVQGIYCFFVVDHSFSKVAIFLGYHFRSVLQDVLNQKETFQSLRRDVLPYLVRSQLVSFLRYHDYFYDLSDTKSKIYSKI